MKMKKLLSLLLALAMAASLTVTAAAAETGKYDLTGAIVILHTNDVHGAVSGYAMVAALKDTYEKMGAYVLLMDAGDFIQGDAAVSTSEGASAVELMDLAGYDAAVPGRHEFDYGYAHLKKLAGAAKIPFLAANVLYQGKAAFADNVTFTSPDGVKIGVFGLTTPEIAARANPAGIKDVKILDGQSLFDCAQAQVDSLKADGCDIIVCLGHLGIGAQSAGSRSTDLLEKVEGIDIFIDGCSHSDLNDIMEATDGTGMVGDTLLTSTGTKLNNVGVVVIASDGAMAMQFALKDLIVTPDKTVADRAAAIRAETDKAYGTVFATTDVKLNGGKDRSRTGETNLGDLIADAMVWRAGKEGIKVDASLVNGGSIRASLAQGDITKKDINTVLPSGDTLSVVKLTGAELLEALEASTWCAPRAADSFPQVSGIVYTLDTTKAFDAGEVYPGSDCRAPGTINRVTIQSVGGRAFREKAVYTLAVHDAMADGEDTFRALRGASARYDLGIALDEVVMSYIGEALKGAIAAEEYGVPAERITVIRSLPFTDVPADASYYDALMYVYENDIFKGFTETTFGPGNTLTRGQMVTVLWRMNGSPESGADCPFGDVAANSPFRKAIAWAAENGLTNGYTAATFAPGQAISRQQFLTILYRYARFMGYDVSVGENTNILSYEDVAQVSEVFIPAMQWACGSGVLSVEKTLSPTAPALRYQVAEFLANFCWNVVPDETA